MTNFSVTIIPITPDHEYAYVRIHADHVHTGMLTMQRECAAEFKRRLETDEQPRATTPPNDHTAIGDQFG
jgi:hypothetical protein